MGLSSCFGGCTIWGYPVVLGGALYGVIQLFWGVHYMGLSSCFGGWIIRPTFHVSEFPEDTIGFHWRLSPPHG